MIHDIRNFENDRINMGFYARGHMFDKMQDIRENPRQWSEDEFEKVIDKRIEKLEDMKENIQKGEFPPFRRNFHQKEESKERLEPLSIRVKPHTKKFLKEESKLSPREILELYENFAGDKETFINSLLQEEEELQKELEEIQTKIESAKGFTENLKEE